MCPKRGGEAGPGFDLRHSSTEDQATHLIPKLLYLFRIGRCAKAFRQCEERFLFLPLRFEALFDQFNQHSIVAEASLPGNPLHLLGQ
jgi:hypothetical protein